MKYQIRWLSIVFLISLFFVGCGQNTTSEKSNPSSIAIKNKEHGYAEHYSADALESLKQSGNKFAVFVGANWCPGCKRLAEQIIANQQMLPKDTAILIADFDSELDLRRFYGVTVKHTGIFFETDGSHKETIPGVLMSDFMAHLAGVGNTRTR